MQPAKPTDLSLDFAPFHASTRMFQYLDIKRGTELPPAAMAPTASAWATHVELAHEAAAEFGIASGGDADVHPSTSNYRDLFSSFPTWIKGNLLETLVLR